jgi:TolA-binding protein
MKLCFNITMKNIFPFFLAFLLLFTFSCAGTPEADAPPDLAHFNTPVPSVEEKIENFEEIEEVDGSEEIAETDEIDGSTEIVEVDEIAEFGEIEEVDGLTEIAELGEIEEVDGSTEIVEVDEIAELEEIEKIYELAEIAKVDEIEEPMEPEVLHTELQADEKPLIADIFDDEDFGKPEELAEVEPAVQDEPEFEEEAVIAEAPQIMQAPHIVQAPPLPQPEPVREQVLPMQTPAQTTQAPRQQPSQAPVPSSLLSPAAAPSIGRDIAAEQGNVPSRDEPPVPARQGIIAPQNDEVVFSRIVRATVGQIVEIPFMGTNWVYLGELASRRGIAYDSSRRESEGQSIIFRAEEAGTYVLKFYRDVFVRGYILNDYVQVIVGEAPSDGAGWFNPPIDRGRVVANPRWPSALQEAEMLRGGSPGTSISNSPPPASPPSGESVTAQGTSPAQGSVSTQNSTPNQGTTPTQGSASTQSPTPAQSSTPTQGTSPVQETVPYQPPVQPVAGTVPERQNIPIPEDMMQRAKEAFDAGNVAAAIALLDQFREYYPSGSDEAYWLYGQFYEANSPSRDILLSLDYYRRLVREYPQSSRISDARRRIAYLERFYINIQ